MAYFPAIAGPFLPKWEELKNFATRFLSAYRKTGLASIFYPKASPVNGRKGPALAGR
jgi:hypothetical protein